MRPRPGRSPTPERHGANDRSPQHRRSSGLSAETAAADAAAAGMATAESPASIAPPPDGAPIGGSRAPGGTSILPALPAHTPGSPVARRKSPVPTEVIASPSSPPKVIRQLDPPLASEQVGVGTLGAAEHASGGSGYSPFPSDSTPNPIHGPGGQPPIQPVVGLGLSGSGIGNDVRSKSRGPGQAGLLRMSKMVVEGDEEDVDLCSGGNKSNRTVRIVEPNGDVALKPDPSGGRLTKIKGSQGNVLHVMGSTMSNGRKASVLNSSRSHAGTPPPGPEAYSDPRGSNGYSIGSDASAHSYDLDSGDESMKPRETNFKLGAAAASVADMNGGMDAHDSLGGGDSLSRWSGINVHVDDTWFDNCSTRTTSADTQQKGDEMGSSVMSMSEQGELSVGDRIAEFRRLRKEKKGNVLFRIFLIGMFSAARCPSLAPCPPRALGVPHAPISSRSLDAPSRPLLAPTHSLFRRHDHLFGHAGTHLGDQSSS